MSIYPDTDDGHHKNADISSIAVREAAKDQLPAGTKNVTVVTISYKDDRLFVRSRNVTSHNNTVNSHVISTEIRGHTVKDLKSAVTLTFRWVYSQRTPLILWTVPNFCYLIGKKDVRRK